MSEAALLVQNARRSLTGTHDVLGYVGSDGRGAHVLLGRDLATSALVGISVTVNAAHETQYAISHALGKTISMPGSMCPECRTPLPELDAFCFHCGVNLAGSSAAPGTPDAAIVVQALATATEGRYEILGRMDREGSTGAVYFARDVDNDQIAALRLTRVDASVAAHSDYVQKLTQIFDTGELQAKIAQGKAQLEVERVAAELAAAERAATARVASERAATERVATQRAAAERAATQNAASEQATTQRAAAAAAAHTPPLAVDFLPSPESERAPTSQQLAPTSQQLAPTSAQSAPTSQLFAPTSKQFAPTSQQLVQSDATPSAESAIGVARKSASMRTPLIGVGVVAVLAVIGYFAFRNGSGTPAVAAVLATVDSNTAPVTVQTSTNSARPITPDTVTGPAVSAPVTAATAPVGTATDSGTIRIAGIPADARVTVDGRTMRGRTLRVTARAHQLIITAKGFQPFTEKLTVASGATIRWAPKLVSVLASNTPANNASLPVAPSNSNSSSTKKSCRDLMRAEDWSAAHDACTTEANAGNVFAEASLGHLYAKGLGVTSDLAAAVTWYKKAAADGDHEAQSFMGYALRDGKGIKRDEKAAAAMFKLAAEGGEKVAQLEYAVVLEKGDGVSKNQPSAREWYKKAADQGVYMAARRLGRMYEKGDGGAKSEPDALTTYEQAATLGDAESAMTVGKWYRDGRGATQSPAQALTWFKKALELGNKDAQNEIKKLQK